jgi:hypothetical protein
LEWLAAKVSLGNPYLSEVLMLLTGPKFIGSRHASINGFFLPVQQAVQQARKSCVALHVQTGWEDWPIGNMGSGVLYRYRGRSFCVFTRHQLLSQKTLPSQVLLRLTSCEKRLFSGGRFVEFPKHDCGPEEHDLCALELPWTFDNCYDQAVFFDARSASPMSDDGSQLYFVIGYPSRLTRMLGEMKSEGMALSQMLVWASQLVLQQGELPKIELMPGNIMLPICKGDFDGFSGGPVFSVNSQTQDIDLRGVVIRGGVDKLYFAPLGWVNRLCDFALSRPQIEPVAA